MKLVQLKALPLNEVYQHVTREQLIGMISKEQLSYIISYSNHFILNGLELSELISRYDNEKSLKLELIKGLFVHNPNSRSDIFIQRAMRVCDMLVDENGSGNSMTGRMYTTVFKYISKYHTEDFDLNLLRKTAHYVTSYGLQLTILDEMLKNNKISNDDLAFILDKNDHLNYWIEERMDGFDDHFPSCYNETLTRHANKLKLMGKI